MTRSNNKNVYRLYAILSLIIGILCIIVWIVPICGIPLAITGIILGYFGRDGREKKISTVGMVLSSIFFAISILNSIFGVILNSGIDLPLQKCYVNYYETTVGVTIEGIDVDRYCYDRPNHNPPLEIISSMGNGKLVCQKWIGLYRYSVYDWGESLEAGRYLCSNLYSENLTQ